MNRFKFVAAVTSLAVLIILVSVILLLRKIGTSSLPQEDGHIVLPGLGATTEIFRDSLGVPYIRSQSDSDAYFALGFVHAQDRLFQMEMYRRLGEGKLSEIFGSKTLPVDELFRTLRFTEMADSLYKVSSPISKDILRWYSDGINAYLSTAKVLPAEFAMLQFTPKPWKPRDSYVVARLMAWELNIAWWTKPVFGELFDSLGAQESSLLIPLFPHTAPKPPKAPQRKIAVPLGGMMKASSQALALLGGANSPDCFGSNNWAISPRRTEDNSAILCNDPHLGFTEPAKWYFVSVSTPSMHVIGVSLPGTPGIVIGRNNRIAWGMTNVMADECDFYLMQPDSANPNEYWYDGKLLPFITTEDTIEVKGSSAYVFMRKMTVLGPVVSGSISNSYYTTAVNSALPEPQGVIALRWSAYWPSDEVKCMYLLNKAGNFQEFVDALKYFGTPAQNFVYADVSGDIAYKMAGNIPLRRYQLPFLPQQGNTSKNVWQSFVPFQLLPQSVNPSDGYIATANNRTTPDRYPFYVSNLYEPSSRIDRINSFLSAHDTMTVSLSRELQLDYYSGFMELLNSRILEACDSVRYSPRDLIYLRNFDGVISPKSTAATILELTFEHLSENVFEPIMGPRLYKEYVLITNVPTRILGSMLRQPELLGDLYGVANGDSLLNLKLAGSLETSLQDLRRRFGPDPINWMWGKIHTLELKHPLSSNSIAGDIYDRGPYPRGGDNTTVNNGEFSFDDPYAMQVGPSMRMIVDMKKDGVYFSLPGGECGQALSPHYSDLLNAYLDGSFTFFPMSLARGQAGHSLLLSPGK